MQYERMRHDEHSSGSGSGCSDLSALENETDTLGRAIIRHERDARRIQAVLNGTSRPFSRALPRPSASQRLQRLTKAEQREVQETQSARVPDVVQEPTVSVARTWGRKQRPERNWTRYETQPQQDTRATDLGQQRRTHEEDDEDAIVPHRTAFTGDDRVGQLNGMLGDDTPPSMRRYRPISEPSSLRHMNSSVLDDRPEETSPMRRVRDISSRLASHARPGTSPKQQLRPLANRRTVNLRPDPDDDKENQPQIKTESTQQVLRASTLSTRAESLARPSHARNDSLQLLKSLARVSSQSPVQKGDSESAARAYAADASTAIVRHSDLPDLPSTPVVTGGWFDTPKQNQSEKVDVRTSEAARTPSPISHAMAVDKDDALPREETDKHQPAALSSKQSTLSPDVLKVSSAGKAIESNAAQQRGSAQPIGGGHRSMPPKSALVTQPRSQRPETLTTALTKSPKHVAFDLDGRTICEHCGGGYANVWEALWMEIRRNFYVRDADATSGVRLTWLGAALLIWLCWYTLEHLLCRAYCKPYFALQMHDFGSYASSPTYPLVLPGLMLQPLKPILQPLAQWVAATLDVLYNWTAGEGSTAYTAPVSLSRRAELPSVLENGAFQAVRTTRAAQWTESVSTLAALSSGRAMASAVEALDNMAELWDANAWR